MGRFSDLDKGFNYAYDPAVEQQAAAKLQNDLRNGTRSPNVHYTVMTPGILAKTAKERPLYYVRPDKPTTSVERTVERVIIVDHRYNTPGLSADNDLFDDDVIESVVENVTDDYNEAVEEDEDPTPNPAQVVKHLLTEMLSSDPFAIDNFEKQAKYIAEAKNVVLNHLLGGGNPQLCYSPYFLKRETQVLKNTERGEPDRNGDYSEPEFKEYDVYSYDTRKIQAFIDQLNEQLEQQTKAFSDPKSNYNKMRKQQSRSSAPQKTPEVKKDAPQPSPVKEPEPVKEEPVKEETVKEETVTKEPVKEEKPVEEEKTVEEEPVKEETVKEETVKEETVKEEPVKGEPVKEEPVMTATETTVPFIQKPESTKTNPCATIAISPALFADQIGNPPYAKHSSATDKLDVKQELLGIDTSAARAEEEKKFVEFNGAVEATQKKQIDYILKQICIQANRPESDAEKYLQEGKLTGPAFMAAVKELSIQVNNEGRKLNQKNGILGENQEKPDPFEKPKTVDKQTIRRILHESTLEKNIGAVDEKFRPIAVDNLESTARMNKYRTELTDALLKSADYTKKELDDAFKSCFTPFDAEGVDYDALKEQKMAFIKQRMATYVPGTGGLDFDQRNEEVFVSECEKLDIALRAYVFPNNGVKNVDEKRAFHSLSKAEYEKFALENITPAALARSMESKLNNYLRERRSYHDKINMETACSYIKHLEDVHQKRPLLTRFVDYFKSGGEDSTIKRMKKSLRVALSKPVDRARIPEVLADENLTYDGVTYEDKFNSSDKQPKAWKAVEEITDEKLEKIDEAEYGTKKLKEDIVNDQKEKEAEETAEEKENIYDLLTQTAKEYSRNSTAKQSGELNK